MRAYLLSVVTSLVLASSTLIFPAFAAENIPKYSFNLPPSADLRYTVKAQYNGFTVNGETLLQWQTSAQNFSIETETRAMLIGKILSAKSNGLVDSYGLAPDKFTEKRWHKASTSIEFDRSARLIRLADAKTAPLERSVQDRNSVIWQLVSVARGAPKNFKPDSTWHFLVTGPEDVQRWSFKVIGREKLSLAFGEFDTLHVARLNADDKKSQQLDIWLAPALEWYPARLRFTDADHEQLEQTLDHVSTK